VLPRVLAEGESDLVARGPPVQLVETFVVKDRLAMDDVLKSRDRDLQTFYARVKELDRALRSNVRRCDYRFVLGVLGPLRWVVTAHDLPLSVGVAHEEEERPNGRMGWPRESR
jgi:hypothetical protein